MRVSFVLILIVFSLVDFDSLVFWEDMYICSYPLFYPSFFFLYLVIQGRVPRPRELEITVLAYAPHFLGLAAAAAAERLKAKVSQISEISDAAADANVGNGSGDGKAADPADRARGSAAAGGGKPALHNRSSNPSLKVARGGGGGKGEGGGMGSVPTGLSPSAVWPDEEAARKKGDVERFRGDPVRVGALFFFCGERTWVRFVGTVDLFVHASLPLCLPLPFGYLLRPI